LSKSTIRKYTGYVLDYAPVIATVLVATFASLSAVRSGIAPDEMLQWILVVLTLLATTQLVDRLRLMRTLDAKADRLIEMSEGLTGIDAVFVERIPDLTNRLREAKSIAINGITLAHTSDYYVAPIPAFYWLTLTARHWTSHGTAFISPTT
jgi:hypothetical protein